MARRSPLASGTLSFSGFFLRRFHFITPCCFAGDHLCDLETDKATIAWEAQDEGYVAAILAPEGASDVPVGQVSDDICVSARRRHLTETLQVVLVICDNEADVPAFASYKAAANTSKPAQSSAAPPAAAQPPPPPPPPPAAPKAVAASLAAKPTPAPAGNGGGFLEEIRRRQWAFSKQYGLPTPQNQYI